jgi:branched-chain amino acid transport system permease protein
MITLLKTALGWRELSLLAIMVAVPTAFSGNRYIAFIVGFTLISILWTAGMNLLTGYTGLVPLVYAGVAGVSAYGTIALVMRQGWSFWLAMPVSSLGAAAVGVLLGLPALRLKGFYFALSSLVIQTVVSLAFVYFTKLTNGDTGISQIQPPDIPFSRGAAFSGPSFELMLAVVAWIGVIGIWAITASPFGRRLIAIREDDVLAETIGIDVVTSKLLAFFISSFYAGVGGALYASYVGFISPRSFDLLTSLNIWLMVAFGGRGTIMGPIIGTVILAPVPFLLQQYHTFKDVIYGSLIITVTVLLPAGIYGEFKRRVLSILKSVPGRHGRLIERVLQ